MIFDLFCDIYHIMNTQQTNQSTIACKPFSLIARNTLKVTYPTTIVHAIATESIIKAKAHKVNSYGVIF